MLDWTDRHCRYFYRVMSKQTVLYTEMVTTGAILFGKGNYLEYNQQEHPVVLQLGGSDVKAMTECAKIAEQQGYDEININVGCPSDRVQNGMFGACLMAEPELVAECVNAMQSRVSVPVTVKHRIGIDDLDSYELLARFVEIVHGGGCDTFIVHARKAILSGLSPKENRQIPPLSYPRVYQLKADYPNLEIILNGGVTSLDAAATHLKHVDGVMIGREAYHNPFMLAPVDERFYGAPAKTSQFTREQVVESLTPYIEAELAKGTRLQHISRHILGLFHAQPRGKLWRRYISENSHKPAAGMEVIYAALAKVMYA